MRLRCVGLKVIVRRPVWAAERLDHQPEASSAPVPVADSPAGAEGRAADGGSGENLAHGEVHVEAFCQRP
jgi:hypothetical protein